MIDKRFYEHKATDPVRTIIAIAIMSLVLGAFCAWAGAIVTANEMGCPKWLDSTFTSGARCIPGPANGLIWNARYRAFPSRRVRANIARWPVSRRRHFYAALNASLVGAGAGVALSIAATIVAAATLRRASSKNRVMIEGTRFWANDDEVFATGLAINYRPPLLARIVTKLRRA